jgi:hypothetical protein
MVMLRVDLDLYETVEVRRTHRESGTRQGIAIAGRIESLKRAVQHLVDRFSERQHFPKHLPVIPDGRLQTLDIMVFNFEAAHAFPMTPAAILQGIRLPSVRILPTDPESYVVELHDGPGRYRRFRDLTMIGVYLHPALELRIIWMGPPDDLPRVWRRLDSATAGLTDWDGLMAHVCTGWSCSP